MAKRKRNQEEEDSRPRITTFKYSDNGNWDLHEGVIIGGKPYFVTYNKEKDKPEITHEIGEEFRILIPPQPNEYSYPPYSFKDEAEILDVFETARNENLDTLFDKSEEIIRKYNDQKDHKLISIASDVVWSYFQDRFPTTRYEVLTGGNGGGKSALADTYGAIGYRPVNMTNPTAAVIYRLLGHIEPGQCTMILEEAERIDQNYEIMAVLKTGYKRDGLVEKTNPVTLKPEFFYSYGFRIIVAERSPNQDSGKGVIDRSFVHSCFKGCPKHDVKEVLNPTNTGGPEHEKLREELYDFRKLLLAYRLIHFKDPIPDLNIGITGRDKELVKPTLQLFQSTKTVDKLVATFQTNLDLKNGRKKTALYSALLTVANNLITKKLQERKESEPFLDGKVEAYASEYWDILPEVILGQPDEKKPGEYHSTEFGTLYKGTIGRTLHDNFGVESEHTKKGALYTFNRHDIERLLGQLSSTIKVTTVTTVTPIKGGGTPNSCSNEKEDFEISRSEKDTPLLRPRHHCHHRHRNRTSVKSAAKH